MFNRQRPIHAIFQNVHFYQIISFLILCTTYIGVQLNRYLAAGRDDTYITLWSAFGVAHGYGFVNYNIQPAEVSSSLLHVLILTVVTWLSPDHVFLINKIIGIGLGLISIVLIYQSSAIYFPNQLQHKHLALLVIVLLICSPVWMYWTAGGLENAIVCLLLLWLMRSLMATWADEDVRWGGIATSTSLLILARSEGFIYLSMSILLVFLGVWYSRGFSKKILLAIVVPIGVFASVTLWRWCEFGLLFPIPTYAKATTSHFTSKILLEGIAYLFAFYSEIPFYAGMWPILMVVACLSIYAVYAKKSDVAKIPTQNIFLTGLILVNHAFVIMVGGDWMELRRFVQPVVPLLSILVISGLVQWYFLIRKNIREQNSWVIIVLNVVCMFGVIGLACRDIWTSFQWSSGNELHWSIELTLGIGCAVALGAAVILRQEKAFWMWYGIVLLTCIIVILPTDFAYLSQTKNVCGGVVNMQKVLTFDVGVIESQLQQQNCAQRRDSKFVEDFIIPQFPLFAKSQHDYVGLISRQAGYIPYYIKRNYPNLDLNFIDIAGLTDPYVAKIIQKYGEGYTDSTELKEYITANNINMFYTLKKRVLPQYLTGRWVNIYSSSNGNVYINE